MDPKSAQAAYVITPNSRLIKDPPKYPHEAVRPANVYKTASILPLSSWGHSTLGENNDRFRAP